MKSYIKMNIAVIVVLIVAVGLGVAYFTQSQNKSANTERETDVKAMVEEKPGVIIDVRTTEEFTSGHLAKADHNFDVTNGEFQSKLDSLDKNKTYYLYCRSGNRSGKAAKIMKNNGFEDVHNIGGYKDLVSAGFESSE